jgi:hypothetical protein
MYIAEELPFLTVLPTTGKVYLRETIAGVTSDTLVTIQPAIYDGVNLAAALATALGAGYAVAYTAVASQLGTLTITTANTWVILSRATLLRDGKFGGSIVQKSGLQDASDILGTTLTDASGVLTLGHGIGYRRVVLSKGSYTFDSIATELQTQLNTGTDLPSYTVAKNALTGRLSISNTNTLKSYIYTSQYLDRNPYSFQGYSDPFYSSDEVTGFTGVDRLEGNALTAASHINLLAYHTLFINSTLGSHNDSIGPVSQSTIARKVVIDNGSFVNDFHSQPYDYIQLDKQSISAIRFRVTDWRGNSVEMSPWSMSIILVPEDEF